MTRFPRDNYLDPDRVPDVFCDGVAGVDFIGADVVRLTFYANRSIGGDDDERFIVVRLVLSREMLEGAIGQLPLIKSGKKFVDNVPRGGEAKHLN
ncbi:hypothetical protein NB311A_07338 [Nitrobacter sp. Nb-311A]|uniref:hypothetical protein n=1 Tax=Nitrobacter sp. Nb-311A TaxID=314253 RepID=UPI0000684C1D|nr:hypothetical protein [Nitrobacter sp. Nb-311A]EAQ36944.1 hypothetical protein NB311A_07338 [Nitrobacter sp. Nb-311A]